MEQPVSGSLGTSVPCGILTSFFYFGSFDFTRVPESIPLILDSGAFSAYTQGKAVDIEAYIEWCRSLEGRYDFAFNLDELGDEATSLSRWEHLTEAGVETAPVIHFGSKPENVLPAYLDQGAHVIALGGMATRGNYKQKMGWAAYVLNWLKKNEHPVATHGLGVHGSSAMARFPFTTIDSSSPVAAFRFARCIVYNPLTSKWVTIQLDGKQPYRYRALFEWYGIDVAEVAVSTPATREAIAYLLARSEITGTLAHREKYGKARSSYAVVSPLSPQGRDYIETVRRSYLASTSTIDSVNYAHASRVSYMSHGDKINASDHSQEMYRMYRQASASRVKDIRPAQDSDNTLTDKEK